MKKGLMSILTLFIFLLLNGTTTEASVFKDIEKNAYYYDAVRWGYEQEIIVGDGKGYFMPEAAVTKAEFLKMYTEFYNFNKAEGVNKEWYDMYFKTLANYELNLSLYLANQPIRRGEVAALIAFSQNSYISNNYSNYDYYSIQEDRLELAQYMFKNALSNGVTTANVSLDEKYGFSWSLKRGEAIQFLYNLKQKKFDTLKVAQKYNLEPAIFEREELVTASYPLSGEVIYHEISSDYENYTGVFVYDGKEVAGYESAVGKTFEGIQIGVQLTDASLQQAKQTAETNTEKKIYLLIDEHRQNTIHAILWQSSNEAYSDVIRNLHALTPENYKSIQQIYVSLINEFRVKFQKEPLVGHEVLEQAAHLHSKDMGVNNYFSHTNLKGESPGDRIRKISTLKFRGWGENIAAGYSNVFIAHIGWINSLGHRQNMLSNQHEYVGLGVYYSEGAGYTRYYTVKLGSF